MQIKMHFEMQLYKFTGVKKIAMSDGVLGGQNWTKQCMYKDHKIHSLLIF